MRLIISLFFWSVIGIVSILIGSIACFLKFFDRSGDMSHICGRLWGRAICFLTCVQVDVYGQNNISALCPQIFISNHQSFFDIFALTAYIPVQFRFAAKENLFNIPFVGWGMRACGHVGIDREDKKKSFRSFLKIVKILKSGRSIFIFPEGTRTNDDKVGDFKKGSIVLAKRANAPIVPITISGSRDVMKKGSLIIRPGKIKINIDKPIKTQYLKMDRTDLLTTMRDNIMDKLKECNT